MDGSCKLSWIVVSRTLKKPFCIVELYSVGFWVKAFCFTTPGHAHANTLTYVTIELLRVGSVGFCLGCTWGSGGGRWAWSPRAEYPSPASSLGWGYPLLGIIVAPRRDGTLLAGLS